MLDKLFKFRVPWDKNDQGLAFGPNRAVRNVLALYSSNQDKTWKGLGLLHMVATYCLPNNVFEKKYFLCHINDIIKTRKEDMNPTKMLRYSRLGYTDRNNCTAT